MSTAELVQKGHCLIGTGSVYSILEFIGEGSFGKVAKCKNLATKEIVAVKILKQYSGKDAEVSMLEAISVLHADRTNVVKFFECFEDRGLTCLVFEMLGKDLFDMILDQKQQPLCLQDIRPIAQQLLVALDALKDIGVIHCDIKPDNIMLVHNQKQTLRVKLIDFGLAMPVSKVEPGMEVQPLGFRAPEICLGLPFDEKIDVFGVGCILSFLYLANNLFPVYCEYQMIKCMVEVLGQPKNHLLRAGFYTHYFFCKDDTEDCQTWRLLTPEEFTVVNSTPAKERQHIADKPSSLDALVDIYLKKGAAEYRDRRAFVNLLKKLLHPEGKKRISAHQALQHPFITMSHLVECPCNRAYLNDSQTVMSACLLENSADRMNTSPAWDPDRESTSGPCVNRDDAPANVFCRTNDIVSCVDDPASESSQRDQGFVSDDTSALSSDRDRASLSLENYDPAELSTDGDRASLSLENYDPAELSTDGDRASLSLENYDPAELSTNGDRASLSLENYNPAELSTNGDRASLSLENYNPVELSTNGDRASLSLENYNPVELSTNGDRASLSLENYDPVELSTNGDRASLSLENYDPVELSTYGDRASLSLENYNPAELSTNGDRASLSLENYDPAELSTDGDRASLSLENYNPAELSTDGDRAPLSLENYYPAELSTNGDRASLSLVNYNPAELSSDGDRASLSPDNDGPAAWSSNGDRSSPSIEEDCVAPAKSSDDVAPGIHPCSCIEISFDSLSYGGQDSASVASAPSGRGRKFLKRIRKFFRRIADTFCCCCRGED